MMRSSYFLFPFMLACGLAWSQPPTPANGTPPVASSTRATVEPRVEHLQVEDAGARIDEMRVGGESQSITVQPKGGMPTYQVEPKTGERSWKVLGF